MTGPLAGAGTVADHGSALRVGIDLCAVSDVAESVERFGDHYIQRIFTPHEIECCRGARLAGEADRGAPTGPGPRPTAAPAYSYESLAARFAAKEATLKVLRPVGARPEWRDIEVHRTPDGWTEIRLSGQAAALAAEVGMDELVVSLTHEESTAAAVVVGVCRLADRPTVPHTTIDRREV